VDGRREELDARPSDAVNLAVRLGAPIFVADEVLAESGEQERSCLDAARARTILGWFPKTTLDEGLAKTVAYYREAKVS